MILIMIPIKRKAKNLYVIEEKCSGYFFYSLINDDVSKPPFVLRRESWLVFTTSPDTTITQFDWFCDLLLKNKKIEVQADNVIYQCNISELGLQYKGY